MPVKRLFPGARLQDIMWVSLFRTLFKIVRFNLVVAFSTALKQNVGVPGQCGNMGGMPGPLPLSK